MSALLIVLSVLCAFSLGLAIWQTLSKQKHLDSLKIREGRLVSLEAQNHSLQSQLSSFASGNPRKDVLKSSENLDKMQAERMELRKQLAHQKEDLRKLKEELNQKDHKLKSLDSQFEKNQEGLKLAHQALQERHLALQKNHQELTQKWEIIQNSPKETPSATQKDTTTDLTEVLQKEKEKWNQGHLQKVGQLTKRVSQLEGALQESEQKIRELVSQVSDWKSLEEKNGGKPVDVYSILKWQTRSLEGKRMYQLMKNMRQLSDEKLAQYQLLIQQIGKACLVGEKDSTHPDVYLVKLYEKWVEKQPENPDSIPSLDSAPGGSPGLRQ